MLSVSKAAHLTPPQEEEPPSARKDTGQLTGNEVRLSNISSSASALGNMPGSGRNYSGSLTNKPGKTAEQQEEPGYISTVGDHPSQSIFASGARLVIEKARAA